MKNSKIIKLNNKSFEQDGLKYELISFNTDKMTCEAKVYDKEKLIKTQTIAFAHIPKKLKAILNPTK